MQAQEYKIVVNRVFSDNGKTLEDIYIEYMAGKIAEVIKEINREACNILSFHHTFSYPQGA